MQLIATSTIQVWLLKRGKGEIFLFREITPARSGAPELRSWVLSFFCAFAKLISDSEDQVKKSCHRAGACSKPKHTPLRRLATILGYWSMGQSKYSTSLLHSAELHFSFHANTSTDLVKIYFVMVYTHFSYVCSMPCPTTSALRTGQRIL